MLNELLWLGLLVIIYGTTILSYKFFGKIGLFSWMVLSVILANIQVMKTIELFGLVTTLGNIIYGGTFLITDILNEKYGEKSARKAVWLGFFFMIVTTIIFQMTLQFTPSSKDFASSALETIFGFFPRIALASLLAFLVSQFHDVWLFNFIKKKTNGRWLWLRNNLSTMTSQLLDNIIFTFVAFYGVFSIDILMQIFVFTYIMKWIVALLDTGVIYWVKTMKSNA